MMCRSEVKPGSRCQVGGSPKRATTAASTGSLGRVTIAHRSDMTSPPMGKGGVVLNGNGDEEQFDLATRLGELARGLEDQDDVDQTLQGIAYAAVGTVPGAE